jgi:hypothetical protein
MKCGGGIPGSTTEDFSAVPQEAADLCRIGPHQATRLLDILMEEIKISTR